MCWYICDHHASPSSSPSSLYHHSVCQCVLDNCHAAHYLQKCWAPLYLFQILSCFAHHKPLHQDQYDQPEAALQPVTSTKYFRHLLNELFSSCFYITSRTDEKVRTFQYNKTWKSQQYWLMNKKYYNPNTLVFLLIYCCFHTSQLLWFKTLFLHLDNAHMVHDVLLWLSFTDCYNIKCLCHTRSKFQNLRWRYVKTVKSVKDKSPLNTLLPHLTDVRLFRHTGTHNWQFVPRTVRVVHSHILNRIWAQICTYVFEKFQFWVKNIKKKWNPTAHTSVGASSVHWT